MRHIHADHMIQAANDTSIQWEYLHKMMGKCGQWQKCPSIPEWTIECEYRQKPSPHPHQAMMDQAKADPSIEWEYRLGGSSWQECASRGAAWDEDTEYRQRPTEHPHQAMIDQAAADPSIEWQFQNSIGLGLWLDCKPRHEWFPTCEYRQKPAEPKMVDMWQWAMMLPYTKKIVASSFHATEDDVYTEYDRAAPILCRIEGSKISVPEVSQ
jgi:hypothetical protein